MKAVLFTLDASYVHKSLSIRCLRAPLERSGFDTVCIEHTIKEKRLSILKRLVSECAEIYCFSCYIWNIGEMLALSEKLKKLLPDSAVIFGGPEVSFFWDDFFEAHPYVDFIICGEGEKTLPALCLEIKEKGLCALKQEKRTVRSAPYDGFADEGFLYREEDGINSSVLYYESCRGCPFSCAYCLSAGETGIRAKDANTVLSELLEFEKLNGGIKVIKFVDRTFNFDKKRANAIWQGLLSEKYTAAYHFEICAELLDDEALSLLTRLPKGKVQLEAGVQSTNPRTLEAINRKGDVKKCLSMIEAVKKLGNIHIHADLIAGLPYEDLNTFKRSFDDLYGKCDMLQLGFLKLLRGSPLYDDAEKYGIVCESSAPYEVLKTDVLSFLDIVTLHGIADVLDRVANSAHFKYTLAAVTDKVPSAFDFFLGLSQRLGAVDGISQLKLISELREYIISLDILPESELSSRLALDYYIYESGSCPSFLSGRAEYPVPPIVKSLAIKRAGGNISPATAEAHRFAFSPDKYYLVDRRAHMCIELSARELGIAE